jgi:preprotein translocase subunit YajC
LIDYLYLHNFVLAADAGGSGSLTSFLILFAPLFIIWYFLVIRPQQTQKRKIQHMLENLKTGDRVLTNGGVYGTIVSFRENVVQLQIAVQVKIDVARSAISGVVTDEPSDAAKQESGKKK